MTQNLSGKAGRRTIHNLTYKPRMEHAPSRRNRVYASLTTGVPTKLDLSAETLKSYEIGSKSCFFGDTSQVNGALINYDFGAFQAAGINVAPAGRQ